MSWNMSNMKCFDAWTQFICDCTAQNNLFLNAIPLLLFAFSLNRRVRRTKYQSNAGGLMKHEYWLGNNKKRELLWEQRDWRQSFSRYYALMRHLFDSNGENICLKCWTLVTRSHFHCALEFPHFIKSCVCRLSHTIRHTIIFYPSKHHFDGGTHSMNPERHNVCWDDERQTDSAKCVFIRRCLLKLGISSHYKCQIENNLFGIFQLDS